MNINTYINKYLLYLNYINQDIYNNNTSYSTITYYKYDKKFKQMKSVVTFTIWNQVKDSNGNIRNVIIKKYENLSKTKLLKILQELVNNLSG